ncbi:MAG: hypothetical protein KBF88_11410 [Polyangiaceae bacterium]|nr:hypothetical protein [Polyangiaceae bacterium]
MRRSLLAFVGLATLGCGVFSGGDEDECKPLAPTKAEDLRSMPWIEVQKPPGFCNAAVAYQYKIYAFASLPVLVDDIDGFDGEMTFPPGARSKKLSGGGAEVTFGSESGELCARHWNTCTPQGAFFCQPFTVVNSNVFAELRVENQVFFEDGAMAYAGGAVWYMEPRGHHGVWRMDPKTNDWSVVNASFPDGGESVGSLTGGNAIGVGNDVWYLINGKAFRFDTVAQSWSPAVAVSEVSGANAASVPFNGKLYVAKEGLLNMGGGGYIFDPATKTTTTAGLSPFQRREMVGFVRNGKIVFGGGYECDEKSRGCWKQDFSSYDPVSGTLTKEPYVYPSSREIVSALDLDDRTIVTASDSSAWVLYDNSDKFVELERNPVLPSCAGLQRVPSAFRSATLTYEGRTATVGGLGANTVVILYLP